MHNHGFLESRENQKGPRPRRFDNDNVTYLDKPPPLGNVSANVKKDSTLIPTMANDKNITPSVGGTGAVAKLEYSLHMQVLLTFVELRLFFHQIRRRFSCFFSFLFTAQKVKFSIKDFFSKYDPTRRKLRI